MKHLVLSPGSVREGGVRVEGADFHYLVRVRRLEASDRISALAGEFLLSLELTTLGGDFLEFKVLERRAVHREGTEVTLFPFLLKGGKLDDVIRQACESGICRIVPVQGDHCVSRLEAADEPKKLERWKAIARQAAQQSGQSMVCEVFPPVASRDLVSWWEKQGPLLVFHERPLAKASLHRYLADKPARVGLVVGPEGGLSSGEVEALLAGGGVPVWLGKSVLRAETAAIHAAAAVNIILQERSEWTIPLESLG